MREWKRGEIQAIGSVAKLLILGGIFVAMHGLYLDFNWTEFSQGLPGSLVSEPFPRIFIAILIFLVGCALSVWLWRIRKKTGISTRPFDR